MQYTVVVENNVILNCTYCHFMLHIKYYSRPCDRNKSYYNMYSDPDSTFMPNSITHCESACHFKGI